MPTWDGEFRVDALGKFASHDSLLKILTSGSLLWSRPDRFNDPFDCQPRFRLPDFSVEAEEKILNEFQRFVADQISSVSINNRMGKATSALAHAIQAGKLSLNEVWAELREEVQAMLSPNSDFCEKFHQQVVLTLQTVKVLCLTKAFDEILMWSHYATNHTGALIVFSPRSNDSIFSIAKPVEYRDTLPLIFEIDEVAKLFTGQSSMTDESSIKDSFFQIILTKAISWKYEREWRIVAGDGFRPNDSIEFNKFHLDDVEAVVFGARYPAAMIDLLVANAKNLYPKTNWYRATLSEVRFGLDMMRVA